MRKAQQQAMTSRGKARLWPLVLLAMFIVLLSGISLAAIQYHQHSRSILATGDRLFTVISERVQEQVQDTYASPRQALNLLALDPILATGQLSAREPHLPRMAQMLTDNPQLNSIYLGWEDGDYLMLRPLRDNRIRQRFRAPQGSLWMLWHIETAGPAPEVQHWFLDQDLSILAQRQPPYDGFDPRQRPWYQQARDSQQQIITTPYVFFSTNEFGTTLARQAGDAVVGADLTLSQLSTGLARMELPPSSERLLYAADGTVIAYHKPQRLLGARQGSPGELRQFTELGSTLLAALAADGYSIERQTSLTLEGRQWRVLQKQLALEGVPDTWLALLVAEDELLTDAYRIRREGVLLVLMFSLIALPLGFLLLRARISRSQPEASRL